VHIDEKATWSDGEKITADDVVYTALRLTSPVIGNTSMMYYVFEGVGDDGFTEEGAESIDGIKAIDDATVQFTTKDEMSLTTFEYSNLRVNHPSFTATDELQFSVDVTNTGKLVGKEAVMLFSSDLVASLVPENRRLRAFKKVELQPGETQTVTLTIKASDLAFVGADGKWILEQGDFRIQSGNQTLNITCNQIYKWDSPNK
jgi:beta-glucosidase